MPGLGLRSSVNRQKASSIAKQLVSLAKRCLLFHECVRVVWLRLRRVEAKLKRRLLSRRAKRVLNYSEAPHIVPLWNEAPKDHPYQVLGT